MKLLLDTHAILWFHLGDSQLSASACNAIVDGTNEKWVSPASYWDVAIKISTGKYSIAQPFEDFWRNAIDGNAFQILPILPKHAAAVAGLSYPANRHRDPFDRLIVAQAIVEGMHIVSSDAQLDVYGTPRVW